MKTYRIFIEQDGGYFGKVFDLVLFKGWSKRQAKEFAKKYAKYMEYDVENVVIYHDEEPIKDFVFEWEDL